MVQINFEDAMPRGFVTRCRRRHVPLTKSPKPKVLTARAQALVRRQLWRIADRLSPPRPQDLEFRLRPSGEGKAFRIVFLVCESGKWGHQSLFDTLAATPGFSVSFAVTLSDVAQRMAPAVRAAHHARQMAIFAQYGPVSDTLFLETDRLRDPRSLSADLVFVQQPWGMQDLPRRLAGRIACAHVSYEMGVIDSAVEQYALPNFHPWLWRMFVPSPGHLRKIEATPKSLAPERVIVSGSPRLDAWRRQVHTGGRPDSTGHRQIAWAPHHSLSRNSLRLGTFGWSAAEMLSLACANAEIRFLLRPHPNLWHVLDRQQAGAAKRFREVWSQLPNTTLSEDGDALPVLLQADALITDSASFLAEFLLTGRPILRLTRPDSAGLSEFGLSLSPGFYDCSGPDDLRQVFKTVILSGQDPLRERRANLVDRLCPPGQEAASIRIRDEILNALTH